MDSRMFDAITRSFARGVTRRRAMKAVLGGAAASALGVLGTQQSQAHESVSRCCTKQCGPDRPVGLADCFKNCTGQPEDYCACCALTMSQICTDPCIPTP